MTTSVALLRGVNVGGGNRLPMADLRATVDRLGYSDVSTVLQSGNIVFRSGDDEATIVRRLGAAVADRHGLAVPVVVRTGAEMSAVLERHPDRHGAIEATLLHVAFLDRPPPPDALGEVATDRWGRDRWTVDGRELFLTYPNGSGRSPMTIDVFERAWGVTATARNLNTVAKLADRCRELGD
jgi:uncharacterized protein (DUF1697 family)